LLLLLLLPPVVVVVVLLLLLIVPRVLPPSSPAANVQAVSLSQCARLAPTYKHCRRDCCCCCCCCKVVLRNPMLSLPLPHPLLPTCMQRC
jgi:hypothetical protein